MTVDRRGRLRALSVPLLCLAAGLCAACSTASARAGPPPVVVAHISTPVTDPAWSGRTGAVFALAEHGTAVTRIDPTDAGAPTSGWRQRVGPAMGDLGRDLATDSAGDDNLYVAQPRAGRIAVVSETSLRQVDSLPGGSDPSYVSTDSGSDHLLVLSGNGSAVTPLDLHTSSPLPPQRVRASPDATVDGAERGRRIDFYVADASTVAHYTWKYGRIEKDGQLPISAGDTAGDLVKSSRLYVAVRGSNRLLAVDVGRGGSGLTVVAGTRLAGPVVKIATGEYRLYAATDRRLYVFSSNSFEGFDNGTFTLLGTVDYRSALGAGPAAHARLNGIAVGDQRVYLTFQGARVILSVAKPPL